MWPNFIVIREPDLCSIAELWKRFEILRVEELIADARVERFDPGVLRRLSWIDEMQQHVVIDKPL